MCMWCGWFEHSTLTEEIKWYFSRFTERIDSPVHSIQCRPSDSQIIEARESCVFVFSVRLFRCQGLICQIQMLLELFRWAFQSSQAASIFFLFRIFLYSFSLHRPVFFFFLPFFRMAAQLVLAFNEFTELCLIHISLKLTLCVGSEKQQQLNFGRNKRNWMKSNRLQNKNKKQNGWRGDEENLEKFSCFSAIDFPERDDDDVSWVNKARRWKWFFFFFLFPLFCKPWQRAI